MLARCAISWLRARVPTATRARQRAQASEPVRRASPAAQTLRAVRPSPAMDRLAQSFGPGRHVYEPFPREPRPYAGLRTLEDLCRRTIIRCATLTRLKKLRAFPPVLRKRLTTLATVDFVQLECAPFKDVFGYDMYHRSLTYRVRCLLDDVEYVAAHVSTGDAMQFSQASWRWVHLTHPNVMCAYALAVDATSPNTFLIMDVPGATLQGLETYLLSQGLCFPERYLWNVAQQLSSVITHVGKQGLSLFRFDLKDVYLVGDKLMLDNGLTGKSWVDAVQAKLSKTCAQIEGKTGPVGEVISNSSMMRLGLVLTKLASIALVDRRPDSGARGKCPFLGGLEAEVPEGPTTYSSNFFDLLVLLHSANPPMASTVCAKATDMVAALGATSLTDRWENGRPQSGTCAEQTLSNRP